MKTMVPPAGLPDALQHLFDSGHVGLSIIDAAGTFIAANDAAHKLYGWPSGSLVGRPYMDLIPEHRRTEAWRNHLDYLDGRRSGIVDIWSLRRPDGSLVKLLLTAQRVELPGHGVCRLSIALDFTDRFDGEERNRILSRAVNVAANGVVVADARAADLPIIFANPSFTRLTGYALSEVEGRNCRFLHREDKVQPGLDILRQAIRRGESCEVDVRNYRRDGSMFVNRILLETVRDEAGTLTHFVGIMRDVTEEVRLQRIDRLQAGVAVLLSERRSVEDLAVALVKLVVQTMDWDVGALWLRQADGGEYECAGYWTVDPVRFAPMVQTMVGRHPFQRTALNNRLLQHQDGDWLDDLRNNPSFRRRPQAEASGLESGCAVPIMLGGDAIGVIEAFTQKRTPRNETRLALMLSVAGQIAQAIDRRISEGRLRAYAGDLESVLNAPLEAVVTIDEGGLIRSANAAFTRIFGYAASEVVGRNVSMLMDDHHRPRHDGYLEAFRTTGIARIIGIGREVQGVHKDGRTIDIQLGVTELPVGSGMGKYVGTMLDITERKRLDAQLREAQKMEAVGQLTGGIAHDFNNLLAVVTGNLELLAEQFPPEHPSARFVSTALRAAERGGELTGRLLAFARRQVLEPLEVDLRTVAGEAAELLRRTIPRAIAINLQLPDAALLVRIDPAQCENAILNLGLNARDAMAGGGELRLWVRFVALDQPDAAVGELVEPGDYAEIGVADTGTGMTAEVAARIFDPFFTTKSPGQGTGLGLSMVYGFVRQSGGHVRLDTEPGRGTTFRLRFPLAGPPPDRPADRVRRILMVEDMPDVRETVAAMLDALGFAHVAVADAEAALRQLDGGGAFDVLLTDIGLPGAIDGLALVDLARTRHPSLRIVTMTGYADRVLLEGGLRRAQHPHLKKPFRRAELAAVLDGLFADKGESP